MIRPVRRRVIPYSFATPHWGHWKNCTLLVRESFGNRIAVNADARPATLSHFLHALELVAFGIDRGEIGHRVDLGQGPATADALGPRYHMIDLGCGPNPAIRLAFRASAQIAIPSQHGRADGLPVGWQSSFCLRPCLDPHANDLTRAGRTTARMIGRAVRVSQAFPSATVYDLSDQIRSKGGVSPR